MASFLSALLLATAAAAATDVDIQESAVGGLALTATAATAWDIQEGDLGSDACPSGYHKLADANECRVALSIKDSATTDNGDNDGPYSGSEFVANWIPNWELVEADWPAGCYHIPDCAATDLSGGACTEGFYFNKHPTGQARQGASTLCKSGAEPIVETGKTVFVGDSDIDYWKDAIETFSPAYNLGVGGFTCEYVLQHIDDWLAYFQPSTVVLVCGENDIAGAVGDARTPEQTYSYHKDIVDKTIATGARVIEMGTKPEPATTEYHAAYEAYDCLKGGFANALAEALANGDLTCCSKVPGTTAPLALVDSYASLVALGNGDGFYHQDELHLSKTGYDLWDGWLASALGGKTCVIWTGGACTTEAANATLDGSLCPDSKAGRAAALFSPALFAASLLAWVLQGAA